MRNNANLALYNVESHSRNKLFATWSVIIICILLLNMLTFSFMELVFVMPQIGDIETWHNLMFYFTTQYYIVSLMICCVGILLIASIFINRRRMLLAVNNEGVEKENNSVLNGMEINLTEQEYFTDDLIYMCR